MSDLPKSDIHLEIESLAAKPGWTPEAQWLLETAAHHQRIRDLESALARVTEERAALVRRVDEGRGIVRYILGIRDGLGQQLSDQLIDQEPHILDRAHRFLESVEIGGAS